MKAWLARRDNRWVEVQAALLHLFCWRPTLMEGPASNLLFEKETLRMSEAEKVGPSTRWAAVRIHFGAIAVSVHLCGVPSGVS